jgi:hypothetical protein
MGPLSFEQSRLTGSLKWAAKLANSSSANGPNIYDLVHGTKLSRYSEANVSGLSSCLVFKEVDYPSIDTRTKDRTWITGTFLHTGSENARQIYKYAGTQEIRGNKLKVNIEAHPACAYNIGPGCRRPM